MQYRNVLTNAVVVDRLKGATQLLIRWLIICLRYNSYRRAHMGVSMVAVARTSIFLGSVEIKDNLRYVAGERRGSSISATNAPLAAADEVVY